MGRPIIYKQFPNYGRVSAALRSLLFNHGGPLHALWTSDTYKPLADFFGLDQTARSILRSDGRNEAAWHNRVQWAKKALVDDGEIECPRQGLWMLTETGAAYSAQAISQVGDSSLRAFASHTYAKVNPILLKPRAILTLEDLDL